MSNSDIAISVRGLSKAYTISHNVERHNTLAQTILHRVRKPFRRTASEIFWALKDVSFDIRKGEVVGIIGCNGAGKSTLLKIMSRITEPTSGHVDLYGRIGSLLEVGTGFHPELTGRENIYLNGQIMGMRRREIDCQFDAIVDFAGTEKFLDTPVKRYSSGMYVRLAFAIAAHLQPEILMVDEVLSVGDAEFQRRCLGKMHDVASSGRTVLFVSHNMGAVKSLCTRAILVSGGHIVMSGDTFETIDTYLKTEVAAATSKFDLSKIKRKRDPQVAGLKLTGIEFNDAGPIRHGEPLKVSITFETYSDVEGVSIGFGFSSGEDVRILSFDTDLLEERRKLSAGTRGTLVMTLPEFPLQPAEYSLDAGARSGDNGELDYMCACGQIEVLPGPNTPGSIVRPNGSVRLPAQWKWDANLGL